MVLRSLNSGSRSEWRLVQRLLALLAVCAGCSCPSRGVAPPLLCIVWQRLIFRCSRVRRLGRPSPGGSRPTYQPSSPAHTASTHPQQGFWNTPWLLCGKFTPVNFFEQGGESGSQGCPKSEGREHPEHTRGQPGRRGSQPGEGPSQPHPGQRAEGPRGKARGRPRGPGPTGQTEKRQKPQQARTAGQTRTRAQQQRGRRQQKAPNREKGQKGTGAQHHTPGGTQKETPPAERARPSPAFACALHFWMLVS